MHVLRIQAVHLILSFADADNHTFIYREVCATDQRRQDNPIKTVFKD